MVPDFPEDLLAELKWLRNNQANLETRLSRVEDSIVFRALRKLGTFYQSHLKPERAVSPEAYQAWFARHTQTAPQPNSGWQYQPLIGILTGVPEPASLRAQTYTNWRIGATDADYTAKLPDHVDLEPGALAAAVSALQSTRPGIVYFDHQILGESPRPVFKPDWSPVLAASCDYLGEFVLCSRIPHEGVLHVPRIAYSTRSPPIFREGNPIPATYPLVSVLVCTRNARLLARCLAMLRAKTDYQNLEVLVIHHTGSPSDGQIVQLVQDQHAKLVPFSGPFNFSEMNNLGARSAAGEILLFLNDDVEPIEPQWLARMAARLERAETGAVGAKLLYPNGTIQHAGIVTWEMDGAGHPGRFLTASDYWPWLNHSREVTAVTGACLAIRRADFESLDGFDPTFPVNFNDVDLCLRLAERGLSVIFEAGAVLRHSEGATRAAGVRFEEQRRFFLRWHERLERTDPFYSPHLAQNHENLSLRG